MSSRARQSHLGTFFACLTMNDEESGGWESQQKSPPTSQRGREPVSPGRVQRLQQRSSTMLINPPLEGFLLKKGAKGITLGWKRRWFVLSDQRLYYYKSSDAARHTQLGFIDLRGSYEIEEGNDMERCHFRIRTPDRLWFLAADAEEECRFWLEGLRSFKKRQQRLSHTHDTIARLRSESEMRLARDGDLISPEEEVLELKRLLEEAELEAEDKARHVDELYHDLQNSIQIIRLKNNQVDLLSQRLEAKASECQRLHELVHSLSQEQEASLATRSPLSSPVSPALHSLRLPAPGAASPPSPLWTRNSWQGGEPSGFPLWRAHRHYNVSAEHRADPHSLPSGPHRLSRPALSPSLVHAPPIAPSLHGEQASPPVSAKLLYEIRQGESLLPSGLLEGDGLRMEDSESADQQAPPPLTTESSEPSPLTTEQFLERLARSMNSFAVFVEGTDHASHEAITYWTSQIRQHLQRDALSHPPPPSAPSEPSPGSPDEGQKRMSGS